MRNGFAQEPLDNLVAVGRVGSRDAMLWFRSQAVGQVNIEVRNTDNRSEGFAQHVLIPDNDAADHCRTVRFGNEQTPLRPDCRYSFSVSHESGIAVGLGEFTTSPETTSSGRYSIAVCSCHLPFDETGQIHPAASQMLDAAYGVLKKRNAQCLLTVGDQIYADGPPPLSLYNENYLNAVAPGRQTIFECTSDEIRRLFHDRYRQFFSVNGWAKIHANIPCYPILDDHEIADNWGSDPAHGEGSWVKVGDAAKMAYFNYQASRVLGDVQQPPEHFGFEISDGPIGIYALDIRSNRKAGDDGQLYSDHQLDALRDFLNANGHKPALVLMLSVPLIHLPRWAAKIAAKATSPGEDFSDRWSWPKQRADRDVILRLLRDHKVSFPEQHLVIASGDIHIGCAHEVTFPSTSRSMYQLTSSAITHNASWAQKAAADLSIRFTRHIETDDSTLRGKVQRLAGVKGKASNSLLISSFSFVQAARTMLIA